MSAAAIAVSPDAKYFVTGFSSAELYALDTGEHLRTIAKSEEQRTLETVSFVKQGIAAAFRYEDIQVVSLDGKERRVLPGGSRNKFVRQLYDGRLVTCIRYEKGGTKRERIRVWNPNLSEFDEPFRRAEGLRMAVWDWEQRWMAATGHYSSKIRICDSETLEDLDALEVLPQVTDLVYSQDANVLATTHSTGDISLRQLPDRSSVYWPRPNWSVDFNAHESVIHDAGFLPDGRLCTCGGDGLIKIWPKRGLPFKSIDRLGGKAEFPEVPRNGQIALRLGGDGIGQIQIGSADMGRWRTSESEHGFVDFEWLPDGNRIVAGRFNSVCLLDGKTFAVLKEVPHTLGAESHPVCVAVSKSGKRVLSATADLVVLRDENLTELKQTKINCNLEAAFSPDDRLVVTSNRDGEMYCLDGNDLSLQAKWNVVQATRSLCWRTNHELIVGCSGGRVFVWDPTTGQRLFTLEGHYDDVHSLALSDDGQILVSADSRTVRLWSMVTHEPLGILLEEANPVISGLRMLSDQTGILILRGLAQDGPSILVLPLE
jgi:WD40 repeat protein